jgi:RAD50-interacting protein 1
VSSLDAYETLSSSFIRAVPGALAGQAGAGVDNRRLTSGVHGLTRLVKALVSAESIKASMEQWGEDLVGSYLLQEWCA